MIYPGFVNADYQSAARTADAERLVNMFVEPMESQGATSKAALFIVPGVTDFGTASGSPGRTLFAEADRLWAVEGTAFGEISESGIFTSRGTVAAGSNPATISSNGDGGGQLLITSGGNAYCFDLDTLVFTQIAALNGKATMGAFLDGYGLILDATTSTFYISALLDFLTWDTGTDFAQRSKAPDPWRSMRVVAGIFIGLYGEKTSEFWYDSGGSSFPFTPHPNGGPTPYGIAAAFSAAVGEGHAFRLAKSDIGQLQVLHATGFTDEVVSDFPRQRIFATYGDVSDAQGEVINWQGHVWYCITFLGANITWVYDLTTNKWFQWGTWIAEQNGFAAHRPRWHAVAFGFHVMLDSETGSIYILDGDVYTDVDSRPVVWQRDGPELSSELDLLFYAVFELDIQPGVGTVSGQGENPQVMMQYSNDGGATWSDERWKPMGKIGQYETRVRWEQCGSARRRVFRVRGSDPVPAGISNAFIKLGQRPRALEANGVGVDQRAA